MNRPNELGERWFPWPTANRKARPTARFRACVSDFCVREKLSFEFSGSGEHLYLLIRKTDRTTREVQRLIAKHYRVHERDVAYAGLKDKRAIATQWFSVRLPQTDAEPDIPNCEVIACARHSRKLRSHDVVSNSFEVVLRDLDGSPDGLLAAPFPNYFGPQRFGRDGKNARTARAVLGRRTSKRNRFLRGMFISALRSEIFNNVLAARIQGENWDEVISGDVMVAGVASGPLWGRGRLSCTADAYELEKRVVDADPESREALEWVGLKQERRALSAKATDVRIDAAQDGIRLCFGLPSGVYATSALRERVRLLEDLR